MRIFKQRIAGISTLRTLYFTAILFFSFLFININRCSSQTILYTQSFGTGTSFPTGWAASGAQSTNLTVNTSSPSTGYTLPSGTAASGSSNMADGNSSPTLGTAVLTVAGVISTTGSSGIKVSYGARKTSAYTGSIAFEWSSDGTNWNTISFTDVSNISTWKAINNGVALTLPAGADNQANLRFRWTFVRTNTSGNYRIDDFTVYTGTLVAATFTELVIPKYIAGNQVLGTNNVRTGIAACFQIDNLTANTIYNLRAGFALSSDAANATPLGLLGVSGAFVTASSSFITSAFTTNASGSSGPVWIFLQPSGNAKFNPGATDLRIRFYYSTTTTFSATYNFQTPSALTTLDAGNTTTYSAGTGDDGAYLKLIASSLASGKYAVIYDNTAGTGNPLYSYQYRTNTITQTTQAELPTSINDIYLQSGTSAIGDAPAIIPIGANNSNGIKRIEIRNADNSLFAYFTKADGTWNDGVTTQNTTTIARAAVQTISLLKGTFDDAGIYSNLSQSGNMTINGALDISAVLTMGSNTLTLNGTIPGNTGTLTGSSTSNLSIGGSSGGNLGSISFTSGNQLLNLLTMNRTGGSGDGKAIMGTDITVKSLTLTKGIVATGNNLFTWDNTGTLTAPNISGASWTTGTNYADSYIAICTSTGIPLTTTNGTKGFRVNSVGSTNTFFPVGPDFTGANRMMINNTGTADDFTVVIAKADISNTPKPRINRIWNVTESIAGASKVTMRLFFKKINDPSGFPVSQDEVENGFVYGDPHLVQEVSNQFVNNANGSDVVDFTSGFADGTEIYGLYTRAVSTNIDNSANPNGITQFSRFSVVNANSVILPVSITNLRAWQQNNAVQLNWTSVNEINIDHYEVERSLDGIIFTGIGSKPALNNRNPQTAYAYTDLHPQNGNNYYRIRSVEKDGHYHYTNIVLIDTNGGNMQIIIKPNPVTSNNAVISFVNAEAGKYAITLFNAKGQQIREYSITHLDGSATYPLVIPPAAAKGIYFMQVQNGKYKTVKKIIVE